MGIKASESIINKIKEFEGYSEKPYLDAKTGKYAVGYGDTDNPANPINKQEAESRLRNRVKLAEQELSPLIKRADLSQEKQDVLVDMHYNLGLGNMKNFVDLVNSGKDDDAAKEILNYVYTTDASTGQKFKLKALEDRASYRSKLWGSMMQSTPVAAPDQQDAFIANSSLNEEIDDIFNTINPPVPQSEQLIVDDYFSAELDDLMAQVEQEASQGADPVDSKAVLDAAADSTYKESPSQWLLKRSEAERLSKKLGISLLDAREILADDTPEEVLARNANALTAQYFPATAKWAGTDQDNYVLMKKTGDLSHKIELKAKALKPEGDFLRYVKQNEIKLKRDAIHLGMMMGNIDLNQGKSMLFDLDQQAKLYKSEKNPKVRQKLEKTWNDVEGGIKKFLDGQVIQGGYETVSNYLSVLGQYAGNLDEYGEEIASSAVSFAPSALIITGALVSKTGVGAVAGVPIASLGVGMSSLLSFGSRMDEALQEFANPNGYIDYDKAFSDPERVSRWRTESGIYSAAMTASDFLLGKVAGKIATSGKGIVPKIKNIAKASVIEEGASEAIAGSSADAYQGKFIQNLPKNLVAGAREATVSPGFIIAGSAAARGSVLAADYAKKGAYKTFDTVTKIAKAKDRADTLASTRQEIKSNEDAKAHKTQIKDLVGEATTSVNPDREIFADDSEAVTEGEIKQKEALDLDGVLLFSPSEFDEFVKSKGFDPQIVIQNLSPEVQDQYLKNKESNSSVTVSIDEWLTFQTDDALDGIDDIAVFPDIGISAKDAAESAEQLANNPVSFLQSSELPPIPDEDLPPPLPTEQVSDVEALETPIEPMQIIEPTGAEGNIVMRPIQLLSRFKSENQKKLMTQILAGMRRATAASGEIPAEALDALAEVQFSHMQYRAEVLGINPKDLMSPQFGRLPDKKSEGGIILGMFQYSAAESRVPSALTKILIAKNADLSTVTHELGHSWLHDMARDSAYIYGILDENLTAPQREYKRAMEDTAKMFELNNIGDLFSMTPAEQTRIHETFAQTAEKYFYEGKFENNRFRAAMEGFRQFLKRIAMSIGNAYKQYPAFKITPEVEKIFETILGASNKVESIVYPMFDEPMFDAKALGADGAKYLETMADARSEAIGETYTNAFIKSEKERDQEATKRLEEFRVQAENTVDQLPAFSILKYFTSAYNDYSKTKQGTDPRFNFTSIAKVFFNGDEKAAQEFKNNIPYQVIAPNKKGGIDVAQFMADNDIHDYKQLMAEMQLMNQREDFVNAEIDKLIDDEIPSIKTEDDIHRIAEQAVNNAGREKLLKLEMKILAEKYLPTLKGAAAKLINPARYVGKESKLGIQIEAAKRVLQSPAAKFNPKRFLIDSDRKGKSAAKYFKSNDIISALEEKYQQMINFKSYEQAQSVYQMLAKGQKAANKIIKYAGKKAAASRYDLDVLNQGRRIIAQAELGPIAPISIDRLSSITGMTPDMLKMVNDRIEDYNAKSFGLPASKNNVAARLSLGEVFQSILKTAAAAKQLELANGSLDDIKVGTIEDIAGTVKVFDFAAETKRAQVTGIDWMFEGMIGKDKYYDSTIFKSLFAPLRKRESEGTLKKREYKNKLNEMLKPLVKKDEGFGIITNPLLRRSPEAVKKIFKFAEDPIASPELGITFKNKYEMHKFMLLMGSNSGAIQALSRNTTTDVAYVIDPQTGQAIGDVDLSKYTLFLQRMIREGQITKDDINFVNGTWSIFSDLHPAISEAMRKTDGITIGKIQPRSLSIDVDGVVYNLTGGYAPISVDKDLKTATSLAGSMPLDSSGISALAFVQRDNFTKERTGGQDPIDLDISTLSSYVNAAVDIAYIREPLANIRKVFIDPQVKKVLQEKAPGAFRGVIDPWFQGTLKQVYTEYSAHMTDRIARVARKGVNSVLYAGNLLTALKQQFGFLQSVRRVNPKYLAIAATRNYTNRKATLEAILQKSAFMQSRHDTSIRDMHKSFETLDTNFDWVTWTDEKVQTLGSFFSQFSQQQVDIITWQGAYLSELDKGKTEQEALAVADDVVARTQGTIAASYMSNLQRGTDLQKLLLSATSIPLINLNEIGIELRSGADNINKVKAVSSILGVAIAIPILLEETIQEVVSGLKGEEEEDDEEAKAKRLAVRMAGSSLSTFYPFYGRFAESLIVYNQPNLGPASGVINKAQVAVQGGKMLAKGVNLTDREARALLDMSTFMTGSGVFSIGSRALQYYGMTKSSEEIEEERYIRRYQIEDSKEDLY